MAKLKLPINQFIPGNIIYIPLKFEYGKMILNNCHIGHVLQYKK